MSLRRILLATLTVLCVLASSTSLEQNDDLSFILIGDWGGMPFFPYRTPIESAVAKQMGKSANEIGAQFVVALGDNFYFHGVKNENDDRFKETFENVFVAPSLQIPWYMCAGNHDHYGNASAEIAYTKKSTRWTFPDFYYSKTFKITSSDKVLELVMIDTVLLCGNTEHDNIKGHATEGPRSVEESETQWVWLEKTLNASKSDYLLVGGHFPVWSIAEHGPTECLVDRLKPLLERYHATAYLCGHDHNLQHLKEPNSTVQYFVTGAGAYVEKNRDHEHSVPAGSLKFFWANAFSYGGFSTVQATTNSLTITFVDAEGRKLYNYAMKPRTGTYY